MTNRLTYDILSTERGKENPLNRKGRKTMTNENMKMKVEETIARNQNADRYEMNKILRNLAGEMGIAWNVLRDWMCANDYIHAYNRAFVMLRK